jgi:hypothetical protein
MIVKSVTDGLGRILVSMPKIPPAFEQLQKTTIMKWVCMFVYLYCGSAEFDLTTAIIATAIVFTVHKSLDILFVDEPEKPQEM